MAKYKLGDIAPIQQGSVPESESYWLLNLDMVESNTGHIYERLYVPFDKIGTSTIAFDTNNVLYSKLRPYLNKVVIPDCPGYATSEMLPLKPNKNYITREYLTYFLRSPKFVAYINEKTSGAKMPRANSSDLKSVEIECPTLENQRHITSEFDRIISIVRLRQQQLQKLDELVKARFVEMFGDPVSNPKAWEMVSLGKRCEIVTGNTPSRAEPENYGEFIEWIKSDNINTPFTFVTKAQEYLSEAGFKKCRFVEAGSLLMTCIAGSINCIGNVAVTDRRVAFNQQINAIVPEQDEVLYLYWLMLLSKPAIHGTINMALKGILSKGQLAKLTFPFPPIELQEQFAAFVEQTDKSKVAVQKTLDEAQLLFDSLMQKYFG